MVCHLNTLSKNELGIGVQQNINTLRSRVFVPKRILVDLHKTFTSLQGAFPGMQIEVPYRRLTRYKPDYKTAFRPSFIYYIEACNLRAQSRSMIL